MKKTFQGLLNLWCGDIADLELTKREIILYSAIAAVASLIIFTIAEILNS